MTRTDSVDVVSRDTFDDTRRHFHTVTGDYPREWEEPTPEQYSVVDVLISEQSVPYTDFGRWGPMGNRIQWPLIFSSLIMGASGQLEKMDRRGPPDIASWTLCWLVYACTMIMRGAVSHRTMRDYKKVIQRLASLFGLECWPLL